MEYLLVRQFVRSLKNLDAILAKAQKHAEARKFDPDNYFGLRLSADMLPFSAQVRIACDTAKGTAANLAGKENPKHEDNEKTFVELRGRIAKCVAYLETFTEKDFADVKPDTLIKMPNRPGKALRARDYLIARQVPNFYFHVATAYDLLRSGGVELGKADYLGTLELVDV
ncbi:MAG: DUF1993 family protein [Polyangia bacterium]